ncbi:MAG: ABC transporter ATP-binding protein [Eubacteriaceae bacterium]
MIEYQEINLKFNEKELFKNFSLSISKNEKVLLTAPSGKGKTTLGKMLLGFIVPDSGTIAFDGMVLSGKNVNHIRKKIAYVSQDADIPKGVVENVFQEVFQFQGNRHLKYKKEDLKEWLSEFSLETETLKKEVDSLSGGERQRLALIMGILLDREVWILDEVTTGLDLTLKRKIVETILSYNKTMIIVSHDAIYENCGLREVCW